MSGAGDAVVVTEGLLRGCAPPPPGEHSDKSERGAVLVVGGAVQTPGAALLAGLAALRAGAGVLRLAVPRSVAVAVAVAAPEALVQGVDETAGGAIAATAADAIAGLAERARAVVIGPGMFDEDEIAGLLDALLPRLDPETAVALDAHALHRAREDAVRDLGGRAVLVPNPAEMAVLLGCEAERPGGDPAGCVGEAVDRFGATVALRGGETWIGAPGEPLHRDESGLPGLATSGSGDVLAGFLGGLLARGATPLAATLWAVHVHAQAGRRAAGRRGPLGFLARELVDELSTVMAEISGGGG